MKSIRTLSITVNNTFISLLGIGILVIAGSSQAATISLGAAESFAVLGGSTVTNTGSSVIIGDVGVSPGSAITGFPPGIINGDLHAADAVAAQAHAAAVTAYGQLTALVTTSDLTGQNLGGLTLTPGIYNFSSTASLTGNLTLDGLGQADPFFAFIIGTTLTTASASQISLINGAQAANLFFRVGTSATLGTGSLFSGNILADQSITITTGTVLQSGRALAINGAVTLDTNNINIVPEPSGIIFLLPSCGVLLSQRSRKMPVLKGWQTI